MAGTLTIGSTAAAQEPPTFADILAAQGGGTDRNWYDYDIRAAGVGVVAESGVAPELVAALSTPGADLTVFLPNDRAFQAWPPTCSAGSSGSPTRRRCSARSPSSARTHGRR